MVDKKANQKATFRLEIPGKNNLIKFKDTIGFKNPKHENKFKTYLNIKSISV